MPQHPASVSVAATQPTVTDAPAVQKAILDRLAKLETKVSELSSDNSRKNRHIQSLQKQLHDVKLENKKLRQENKRLRQLASAFPDSATSPALSSLNSSTPPSKDSIKVSQERTKRTQSLRQKSDRPVGGQPGHKGTTLHQSEHIDKIEATELATCTDCSCNLSHVQGRVVERRKS